MLDDLADPDHARIRHPATAQAAQGQLPALRRRAAQRAVAGRHHPLALADGTGVEILNFIDDHSRSALASHALHVFKGPTSTAVPRTSPPPTAIPPALLTDNGAVFTGRTAATAASPSRSTLHARGIVFKHSRPYHPQTCGKVERFHQTLKKWLSPNHQRAPLAALQTQLDTFRRYYNHRPTAPRAPRPTPAQAYTARPKATPTAPHARRTLPRPPRHASTTPACSPCATTAACTTSASAAHAGTHVLILVHDLDIRVLDAPTANYSANSPSTPPATTSPPGTNTPKRNR